MIKNNEMFVSFLYQNLTGNLKVEKNSFFILFHSTPFKSYFVTFV